ncbi:hypothetical protein O3M35_002704 [Rhynocoris fuscipes]|uniref:Centrosome-associated protein 350 n=1 Tax=Rhynocoris fuscipes TaxID=488301 RepID=A0AAW1CQ92_9HEMI
MENQSKDQDTNSNEIDLLQCENEIVEAQKRWIENSKFLSNINAVEAQKHWINETIQERDFAERLLSKGDDSIRLSNFRDISRDGSDCSSREFSSSTKIIGQLLDRSKNVVQDINNGNIKSEQIEFRSVPMFRDKPNDCVSSVNKSVDVQKVNNRPGIERSTSSKIGSNVKSTFAKSRLSTESQDSISSKASEQSSDNVTKLQHKNEMKKFIKQKQKERHDKVLQENRIKEIEKQEKLKKLELLKQTQKKIIENSKMKATVKDSEKPQWVNTVENGTEKSKNVSSHSPRVNNPVQRSHITGSMVFKSLRREKQNSLSPDRKKINIRSRSVSLPFPENDGITKIQKESDNACSLNLSQIQSFEDTSSKLKPEVSSKTVASSKIPPQNHPDEHYSTNLSSSKTKLSRNSPKNENINTSNNTGTNLYENSTKNEICQTSPVFDIGSSCYSDEKFKLNLSSIDKLGLSMEMNEIFINDRQPPPSTANSDEFISSSSRTYTVNREDKKSSLSPRLTRKRSSQSDSEDNYISNLKLKKILQSNRSRNEKEVLSPMVCRECIKTNNWLQEQDEIKKPQVPPKFTEVMNYILNENVGIRTNKSEQSVPMKYCKHNNETTGTVLEEELRLDVPTSASSYRSEAVDSFTYIKGMKNDGVEDNKYRLALESIVEKEQSISSFHNLETDNNIFKLDHSYSCDDIVNIDFSKVNTRRSICSETDNDTTISETLSIDPLKLSDSIDNLNLIPNKQIFDSSLVQNKRKLSEENSKDKFMNKCASHPVDISSFIENLPNSENLKDNSERSLFFKENTPEVLNFSENIEKKFVDKCTLLDNDVSSIDILKKQRDNELKPEIINIRDDSKVNVTRRKSSDSKPSSSRSNSQNSLLDNNESGIDIRKKQQDFVLKPEIINIRDNSKVNVTRRKSPDSKPSSSHSNSQNSLFDNNVSGIDILKNHQDFELNPEIINIRDNTKVNVTRRKSSDSKPSSSRSNSQNSNYKTSDERNLPITIPENYSLNKSTVLSSSTNYDRTNKSHSQKSESLIKKDLVHTENFSIKSTHHLLETPYDSNLSDHSSSYSEVVKVSKTVSRGGNTVLSEISQVHTLSSNSVQYNSSSLHNRIRHEIQHLDRLEENISSVLDNTRFTTSLGFNSSELLQKEDKFNNSFDVQSVNSSNSCSIVQHTNEARGKDLSESKREPTGLTDISNISSYNISTFSIEMLNDLLKDADLKYEHFIAVIKMQEKALIDRAKAEIAYLEMQKRELKEQGRDEEVRNIKKKQRGVVVRVDEGIREIQRIRKAEKNASRERKLLIQQQQQLLKLQLGNRYHTAKRSPNNKIQKIGHGRSSTVFDSSANINCERGSSLSPYLERKTRELQEKENALNARKKNLESIVAWKQRLDQEERHVQEMEKLIALSPSVQDISAKPSPNVAIDRGTSPMRLTLETGEQTSAPEVSDSTVQEQLPSSQLNTASQSESETHNKEYNSDSFEQSSVISEQLLTNVTTRNSQNSLLDNKRRKSLAALKLPLSPRVTILKRRHSSGSDESILFSQNETLSDQSDMEVRVSALQQQLKMRKVELEKLRKEYNKSQRERLKAKEQALINQIHVYDTYIEQLKNELQNESEKNEIKVMKPLIKQPKYCDRRKSDNFSISLQEKKKDDNSISENSTVNDYSSSNKTLDNVESVSEALEHDSSDTVDSVKTQLESRVNDTPDISAVNKVETISAHKSSTPHLATSSSVESLESFVNAETDINEELEIKSTVFEEISKAAPITEEKTESLPNIESHIASETLKTVEISEKLLSNEKSQNISEENFTTEAPPISSEINITPKTENISEESQISEQLNIDTQEEIKTITEEQLKSQISSNYDINQSKIDILSKIEDIESEFNNDKSQVSEMVSEIKEQLETISKLLDEKQQHSDNDSIKTENSLQELSAKNSETKITSSIYDEEHLVNDDILDLSNLAQLNLDGFVSSTKDILLNEEKSIEENNTDNSDRLSNNDNNYIVEINEIDDNINENLSKHETDEYLIEITEVEDENDDEEDEDIIQEIDISQASTQPDEFKIYVGEEALSPLVNNGSGDNVDRKAKIIDLLEHSFEISDTLWKDSLDNFEHEETPLLTALQMERQKSLNVDHIWQEICEKCLNEATDAFITAYIKKKNALALVNGTYKGSDMFMETDKVGDNEGYWTGDRFTLQTAREAEQLRLQQLQIEQEIEELEQAQETVPYYYVREIPNKPPPPYTPPGRVAPTAEETLARVKEAASMLWDIEESGGDIASLQLPHNYLPSTNHQPYRLFLFDLAKELYLKVRPSPTPQLPAWIIHKRPSRPTPKISTKEELLNYIEHQAKLVFNYEPRIQRENMIMKWSRKKRDQVDDILIKECQDEEHEWIDFTIEENLVKNQLADSIIDHVLDDAVNALANAFNKKFSNDVS